MSGPGGSAPPVPPVPPGLGPFPPYGESSSFGQGPLYGQPSPYGWVPPPVAPSPSPYWAALPHAEPRRYHQLLRTRTHRWWKTLLGLPAAVAVWVVLSVVLTIGFVVWTQFVTEDRENFLLELEDDLGATDVLLFANLSLAVLIPACWVAVLLAHQHRIGWLSSVARRLRWRLVGGYALLAVAVLGVSTALAVVLPESLGGGLPGIDPPAAGRVAVLAAVFLITTPLQAAAEEYFFRGYLAQAIGSWIRPERIALGASALVTATLFAVAHGQQDFWLFTDRFAFGLIAAFLVYRTGGLEATIALHTVNNLLAFAYSTATGGLAEALAATEVGWQYAVLDIAALLTFLAATWWWTARHPHQTVSVVAPAGPAESVGRAVQPMGGAVQPVGGAARQDADRFGGADGVR